MKDLSAVKCDGIECVKCKDVLPPGEFYKSSTGKLDYYCKSCRKSFHKKNSFSPAKKFTLEPEQLEAMMRRQKRLCGRCRCGGVELFVEGDTEPRALLCESCYRKVSDLEEVRKTLNYYLISRGIKLAK